MLNQRHKATIQKVLWKDVREDVLKVNPSLVPIIDNVDPGNKYFLYKAAYPFGRDILYKGTLQLPTPEGNLTSLYDSCISSNIKDQLKFRFIPLSLILNRTTEVYFEMEDRIVSLNYLGPGVFFGLWEALDPPASHYIKHVWNIVSGARSLYMLPKITDAASHKELRKKYGVRTHIPKNLLDHQKTFVEIANSQQFEYEWASQILFFSDKWMEETTKDIAWSEFRNYLLQYSWAQSQYWRNKVTFDFIWQLFTQELILQNIKPNIYLLDIVKHLVLVSTGVLPGSKPADSSDIGGPLRAIQEVYINDYKLRDYVPTIMQPHHFSINDNVPVYYSFQQPTMIETSASSKRLPSILNSIREIEFLVETFRLEVLQGKIQAENTPIDSFAKNVLCDYFHSEAKEKDKNTIRPTKEMPFEDKNLIALSGTSTEKNFCETSQFLRGCVRLRAKL